MEKSREEYLKLIEYRQIKEKDLPKELLSDEEFVRQVYKIDKFIVYVADTEISAKIFREEVETKPHILSQFPKKVLLICEEECIKALKETIKYKDANVKMCPKEILINHPDLCDYLLEEGVSPEVFPEEVLSRYPSDYIEDLKIKSQERKKAEKMETKKIEIMPKPLIRINKATPKKEVANKGETTKTRKIYPKEVLLRSPELAKISLKRGVPLENIPEKCQLMFPELCIEHLKDGDYESNFKHLSDKIKLEHIDVCVAAIKDLGRVRKNGYVKTNEAIYGYIPKELYSNIDFIKSVLQFDEYILKHISEDTYSKIGFTQKLDEVTPEITEYVEDQASQREKEKRQKLIKKGIKVDDTEMLKRLTDQEKARIGPEWQEECLSEIKDKHNVILSSPTGSGKTRVFLEWAKQKPERPIYITAPIKALSNQRYRELKEQGFIVGIETGDRKYVPENCDFICCTQEIYRNKYTEQKNATLIIDEFHYIFENNSRARAYTDAVHDSKAKNILICSATLGDMNKLLEYVNRTANRSFFPYENHDRLTELEFKGKISKKDIKNALVVAYNTRNFRSMCDEISLNRTERDEEEINKIREIAKKYGLEESELEEYAKKSVMYYYGKMLPKEKLFIEELFENKLIDTVVGTDALSMGVNFPIENVVFAEMRENKNLFDQLAGRAGRKGYFDKGYVYYCDDFEWQKTRKVDVELGYSYYEVLFSKNESILVSLKPHIQDILLGKTTIEEDLEFIAKYSTEPVDLEQEREKIESIIDYIQNYDLVQVVIKKEFGKKIDEEKSAQEERKLQEEIDDRRKELMPLQEEFKANIARAYFEVAGVAKNCNMFKNILLGKDLDNLIRNYGSSFADLLEFRQYVRGLPKVYRQSIDIVELENRINSIDSTVLNFERGALSTDEIASGVREELLEKDELKDALNTMVSQLGISEKRSEIVEMHK